jgi:fibronectin-binding autotransporter adhesin
MKTRYVSYSHAAFVAVLLATFSFMITSSYGQSIYAWTNQNPTHLAAGDMNQGTNWDRILDGATFDFNGVPRPDFQDGVTWGDTMLFDGRTTGPLLVTQNGGSQANGAGSGQPYGLRIELSPNQTSPVTIYSPVPVSGGMRMNWFTVDPGAGALNIGDHSTNILDIVGGVQNGQVFGFTNNSTTTAVVNETVRWRMGGAGAHPHIFSGPGDWLVNNHMRSQNQSAILVQKYGLGTMTWVGTNFGDRVSHWGDTLGSPIRIEEGTMIWKTSDLVGGTAGNPGIVNNALWKYDANDGGTTIAAGTVSGVGTLQMLSGTLSLSGGNTFSGPINLTGGTLIAAGGENVGISGPLGQGGVISFNGGTLSWSPGNAFDYSSRFDTGNNQAYKLDTAGASPTLATALTSSGGSLTKLGGGTLTLSGNSTYTGLTTVSAGTLAFQGTKSGNANITVADGATLSVIENNSQITPNTLTVGTSSGATLEFNNVTNHTTATLAPNSVASAGPITIFVNSGQFFFIGDTFPLLKWTSGTAPAVNLGFLAGAGGHLVTNVNEIDLVIDDPPYIWTGAANSIWNTTSIDWTRSGSPVTWVNAHYALLDDSAGANTNLTLSGTISPTNVTISSTAPFAITNSSGNTISGPGSLTKTGNGTLILPGGANNYTGVTTIGGGVLTANVLANGGSASDIGAASSNPTNIVLNGGTLQYSGPGVSIDRLFSVGPAGGTIDSEGAAALVFNNSGSIAMSGNGPRTLTLTGPNAFGDTIAGAITNHPAATSLKKTGPGTWILTGTNTYAGGTALLEGSLQIGNGGSSGTLGNGNVTTAAGTAIDFQRAGTLTVPGAISGNASVAINSSGTIILANNNSYNGGTTINTGTLQVGNGGGSGSLFANGPIVNNSLLIFNTSGAFNYQGAGLISGPGNVIVRGNGTIKAIGVNSYTGWTLIDTGTTFWPREGQDGGVASTSVITNNGTLRVVEQNAAGSGFAYAGPITGSGRVQIGANNVNVGQVAFTGTNSYTGGTFIGGNELILGDASNPGFGTIAGNVQFVNNFTIGQDNPRRLTFNRPTGDDFTFSGTITTNFNPAQVNQGIVQLNGGATITFTGNNTYAGGTIVNAGALKVGSGGGSGSVGFGPVTLTSGAPLIINRTGNLEIRGAITGAAEVQLIGSGTVSLTSAANAYTLATTVSNGTLVATSVGTGDLNVEGGTIIVRDINIAANLNVGGNMNIDSGTIVGTLNKNTAQSNTTYTVSGTITRNGGTLKLYTAGQALAPGDKFFIFNQPVIGGASMPIISPGCTLQNNLAVDGSVTVLTAQPLPTSLSYTMVSSNTVVLSWPAAWTGGVRVQGQTNSATVGLRNSANAWGTIQGTDAFNSFTNTINPANGAVFFRLVIP